MYVEGRGGAGATGLGLGFDVLPTHHNTSIHRRQIHISQPLPGDILVFLTGQEEIETAAEELQKRALLITALSLGFWKG